ncbi:hypothetical protein Pcinc_004196 [Petrolisthes cinctipes]|uniref:Nuclease HARBI1 n=1 Tax=Petrolisthes cinctipes TaxID=88211 RepID=A0AAE1L3X9_PETCI|nr:hypothetical protein Pcinc_004196 [Petrolisthes cinctipes]
MDFYMDFDFPQDRWLFYQNIQNANGILEEHQRRRRIRRVVSDRMNPFVAMEDQECIARFRLRKDTMHDLIQEIQDELLVTQDRKGVPIPPHLQVLIAVASMGNGSYQIVQGDCFSVSQTSVSRCVARVSCAIARRRETYVKFPEANATRQTVDDFYAIAGMPGRIHVDIHGETAMQNTLYICHSVQELLSWRGYPWTPGGKKQKKAKKGKK